MKCEKRIVLVDGYALIYRSFYAIRGLTSPDGAPTNALYGVARYLMKLEDEFPHSHGSLVLDKGKATERIKLLPEYKATRPPTPDDLRSQVAPIREWAEAAGWPILVWEGHEADDLIAAVVAAREGLETLIFSGDKDFAQLVQSGVTLMLPGKKGMSNICDREAVVEKFGVPPEAIIDYLALVGDSVDNIKGVEGVGAKTAASLLQEFGTIDHLLVNLDRVSRVSLREKLSAAGELLALNRKLVALDTTLPPDWEGLQTIARREPDWERMLELAGSHGFKSLRETIAKRLDDKRNPTLFDF
ncbi:MAG: hypothetical protein KAI66_19305 [Lentisphaeria bacterium]|nr:hypothetical protein [Lentisphaeria bacterium]